MITRRRCFPWFVLLLSCVLLPSAVGRPGLSRDVMLPGHHGVQHVVKIELASELAGHTLVQYHTGPWDQAKVVVPNTEIQVMGAPYTAVFTLLPPGTEVPEDLKRESIPTTRIDLTNPIPWERSAHDADPTQRIETDLRVEPGPEGPVLREVETRRLNGEGQAITTGSLSIAMMALGIAALIALVMLMGRRQRAAAAQQGSPQG